MCEFLYFVSFLGGLGERGRKRRGGLLGFNFMEVGTDVGK